MNLHRFFNGRSISDKELGKRVREAHLRHLKRIEENTPLWQQEGAEKRRRRDNHKITRQEMKEKMGISEQTIAKFENGGSVRSRNMLSKSFDTAIDCILLEREKAELEMRC